MRNPTKEKLQELFHPYLQGAPDSVIELLIKGWNSLEHPIYHPERTLGKHIEVVFKRAKRTEDTDLIFAAILHDIFKADKGIDGVGGPRSTSEGWYWSNSSHDEQAYDFIMQDDDVWDWIDGHGGHPIKIAMVCKYHMRMKLFLAGIAGETGGMGWKKRIKFVKEVKYTFPLLHHFVYLDDMLNRYK